MLLSVKKNVSTGHIYGLQIIFHSRSYILNSYAFPHFFVQGDAAISYGTSPEWVEVDGMIVSRSGTTVHLTNALNSLHNSATSRSNAKTTNSHGYVSISLIIVTYCHVIVFHICQLFCPPVDLYLISEKSIWKNQVRQTGFLVYIF